MIRAEFMLSKSLLFILFAYLFAFKSPVLLFLVQKGLFLTFLLHALCTQFIFLRIEDTIKPQSWNWSKTILCFLFGPRNVLSFQSLCLSTSWVECFPTGCIVQQQQWWREWSIHFWDQKDFQLKKIFRRLENMKSVFFCSTTGTYFYLKSGLKWIIQISWSEQICFCQRNKGNKQNQWLCGPD